MATRRLGRATAKRVNASPVTALAEALSVSSKDVFRSDHGVLKSATVRTMGRIPELRNYLSQVCGISVTEANGLIARERLFAQGKPVREPRSLRLSVPAEAVEKLQLEIQLPDGSRVPVSEPSRHRFYGFFHASSTTKYTSCEDDPRSFIHAVRAQNRSAKPGTAENLFDSASTLNIIGAPGVRLGFSGLALLTNDVSVMPHFEPAVGFDGAYRIILTRGTPEEAARELESSVRKSVLGINVLPDVESQVQRVVELHSPSEVSQGRWVLEIGTPLIQRHIHRRLTGARPDEIACVRCGCFSAAQVFEAAGGALRQPRSFRGMTEMESAQMQTMIKRLRVNRIVASLRNSTE